MIINIDVYLSIFLIFFNLLDDSELTLSYFQEAGVTYHTSIRALEGIKSFFEDRIVLKGLWLPQSQEVTPPDFSVLMT
jgi:hypothetical protein